MITLVLGLMLAQAAPAVGEFVLVEKESDSVPQAIERVVAKMSVFTRGVARGRIAAKAAIYPRVSFAREGEGYRVVLGQNWNVALKEGGAPVEWKSAEGEVYRIRLLAGFTILIDSADGQRENRFTLAGDRLTMTTKMTSARLPAPLEFRLVYRRR